METVDFYLPLLDSIFSFPHLKESVMCSSSYHCMYFLPATLRIYLLHRYYPRSMEVACPEVRNSTTE